MNCSPNWAKLLTPQKNNLITYEGITLHFIYYLHLASYFSCKKIMTAKQHTWESHWKLLYTESNYGVLSRLAKSTQTDSTSPNSFTSTSRCSNRYIRIANTLWHASPTWPKVHILANKPTHPPQKSVLIKQIKHSTQSQRWKQAQDRLNLVTLCLREQAHVPKHNLAKTSSLIHRSISPSIIVWSMQDYQKFFPLTFYK